MTDPLPACPFCGTAPYTNVNGDPTGFGATIECIAGKCSVNPRVHADAPTLSRAEEWAAKRWRARALGPALDVVLENLRDNKQTIWGQLFDNGSLFFDLDTLEKQLRALRDAHSPTATPSGSGAQSGGGEAERGS